ncbi:MAG: ATP-binding protein [Acidobacteria bacterium]|nr:ATP-binding protein [Acidobacteriota bacterium]
MEVDSGAGRNRENNDVFNLLDMLMPGDTQLISGVTDAVAAALVRLNVPEEKRQEIALAVQEALVNAVVHGCKNDHSKEVRCRLQHDPQGRIVVVITDPGRGFRLEDIADPKNDENLYADHGRGVYLIRQLMDEVHFENGGNQIRMWKY